MLRAGSHTLGACGTLVLINLCHAVYHMDGTERACLLTGTQTQAGKGTFLVAVCHADCTQAILNALIVCTVLCGLAVTGAMDMGNHLFALGHFYAENLCDLFCGSSAADRTAVHRCFAFDNSSCQTITARVATAATVCARQALLYCRNTLIYFDRKDLGCKCKDQAEQQAHDTQNQHCKNNRIHQLFTPIL